jgi:hypothetical protein
MKDIKTQLRELIATSRTRDALAQLEAMIRPDSSTAVNQLVILRGDYTDLAEKEITGTLTDNELRTVTARLRLSILRFVDELGTTDLRQAKRPLDVMEERMVVICTQERIPALETLFPKAYFPYLTFQTKEEIDLPPATEIVVYDFPEGADPVAFRSYLDAIDPTVSVLYYGASYQDFLTKAPYVDRVHRANTRFSVHARLRELALFLRYTYKN